MEGKPVLESIETNKGNELKRQTAFNGKRLTYQLKNGIQSGTTSTPDFFFPSDSPPPAYVPYRPPSSYGQPMHRTPNSPPPSYETAQTQHQYPQRTRSPRTPSPPPRTPSPLSSSDGNDRLFTPSPLSNNVGTSPYRRPPTPRTTIYVR